MKKVLVVDGQGGKIGRGLVTQLLNYPELLEVTAVGTNSMQMSSMQMKRRMKHSSDGKILVGL